MHAFTYIYIYKYIYIYIYMPALQVCTYAAWGNVVGMGVGGRYMWAWQLLGGECRKRMWL